MVPLGVTFILLAMVQSWTCVLPPDMFINPRYIPGGKTHVHDCTIASKINVTPKGCALYRDKREILFLRCHIVRNTAVNSAFSKEI